MQSSCIMKLCVSFSSSLLLYNVLKIMREILHWSLGVRGFTSNYANCEKLILILGETIIC